MATTRESTTTEAQQDDSFLMPPPMPLSGLNITSEPRSAPVHLHMTLILRKIFARPQVISPFADNRLTAKSLVGPLQTIYRGVCMPQDQLQVARANVTWLREVPSYIYTYDYNQIHKVQKKHNDLTEAYAGRERSLVTELEYTRSRLYGKNYLNIKFLK